MKRNEDTSEMQYFLQNTDISSDFIPSYPAWNEPFSQSTEVLLCESIQNMAGFAVGNQLRRLHYRNSFDR